VTRSDKVRSYEIGKDLNDNHFSSESRDPSYVGSAMRPECQGKDWRGKSCWLYPRQSGQEFDQGPGGVTTPPTVLGPVLVSSQQDYLRFLLTVRYLESSYGYGTRDPRQRKNGHENE